MTKFKIQRVAADGIIFVEEDHARAALEKFLTVAGVDGRRVVEDFANPDTKVRYMTVSNGTTYTVTKV